MLAGIRDLQTDGMNPIEHIEKQNFVSGQRMRRGSDTNATPRSLGDAGEPYRSSGEVKGEFFEFLWFIVKDELVCVDGKARGVSIQQLAHEVLGEPLGTVNTR